MLLLAHIIFQLTSGDFLLCLLPRQSFTEMVIQSMTLIGETLWKLRSSNKCVAQHSTIDLDDQ